MPKNYTSRGTVRSRALAELASKKLVECLTPSEKVGRIYRLSREGRRVLGRVKGLRRP